MSEANTLTRPTHSDSNGAAGAPAQRGSRPLMRETLRLDQGQVVDRVAHAHPPVASILREGPESPAPIEAPQEPSAAANNAPLRKPTPTLDRERIRNLAGKDIPAGDPEHITAIDLDEEAMRRAGRADTMTEGAMTPSYHLDPEAVWKMLNDALATELVCALRYRRHYFTAHGLNSPSIAAEFHEHSRQEMDHADKLARRIVQLGGKPDFNPDTITARAHAEYDDSENMDDMLRANLIAERVAIEAYRQMIAIVGQNDPTTRRVLEDILAEEEEHANELRDLIQKN